MGVAAMSFSGAQLFFGHISPAEAHVYARVAGVAPAARIEGVIAGPRCAYSSTLQARIPVRVASLGEELLLEAVVPDPCFWTPELPFLYDVELTGNSSERFSGVIGFRPLATLDRQFRFAGTNWVLRGARFESVTNCPLEAWHEHELAMVVDSPEDALCQQASELGVLLIATIAGGISDLVSELRRLARWPAVGIVVLESDAATTDLRRAAPNVVAAGRLGAQPLPEQCKLGLAPESAVVSAMRDYELPIVVERQIGSPVSIEVARQACDLLQRDVAELLVGAEVAARPAGYIV